MKPSKHLENILFIGRFFSFVVYTPIVALVITNLVLYLASQFDYLNHPENFIDVGYSWCTLLLQA